MYKEDFKIASKISSLLGFKLNSWHIDNNGTKLSTEESLFCSIYSKLGITNWFRSPKKFLYNPKFIFSGFGGENLRGIPLYPINQYIYKLSGGYHNKFYNSSFRLCERSKILLQNKKTYYNDYELSTDLYLKGRTRHHFGKTVLEAFLVNEYILCPLIDPDIIQLKYDINANSSDDLIAYILVRLAHNLLFFPFTTNRKIRKKSILNAKILNKKFGKYKIKNDFYEKFYIDIKRISPISPQSSSKINRNIKIKGYLIDYFNNPNFINNVNQIYDNSIYFRAKKGLLDIKIISLIAVEKILKDLSFNYSKKKFK